MRALPATLVTVAAGLAACASPQQKAEREALKVFNRCVVAVQEANQALYDGCLSRRLLIERERERDPGIGGAEENLAGGAISPGTLRAYRDLRPHKVAVERVEVSPDARRVSFFTRNRSHLLEREIEHRETVEVIRQADRWVIDRDCCEYAGAAFVEPAPDAVSASESASEPSSPRGPASP